MAFVLVVGMLTVSMTIADAQAPPPLDLFYQARDASDGVADRALRALSGQWHDGYTSMVVDMARLLRPAPAPRDKGETLDAADEDRADLRGGRALDATGFETSVPVRRESLIRARLLRFLDRQTGQRFGENLNGWREWMWKLPPPPHPNYAEFKGVVYGGIDPRFRTFFPPGVQSLIRLDEVDWGGVMVNGIPPLYGPKVVGADQATYLRDGNLVFGVVVNGEARAYPKRILAWHEMAVDRIGGIDITVVYCTLCGTVIPYESVAGGRTHRFGTSGLLYRSNKLMFDDATKSLWSTLDGRPVIGPLAGSGLQLTSRAAVTTTWGEWRAQHPNTTVLSIDTGHRRDYSEGAAYRHYFATDELYFRVSHVDRRLKNKAEVLTLHVQLASGERQAVAIDTNLLKRRRVYEFAIGGQQFVVATSSRGANRLYASTGRSGGFAGRHDGEAHIIDTHGRGWRVTEEALISDAADGPRLPRVSAHRAFWFGWVAQFPNTTLIQ